MQEREEMLFAPEVVGNTGEENVVVERRVDCIMHWSKKKTQQYSERIAFVLFLIVNMEKSSSKTFCALRNS